MRIDARVAMLAGAVALTATGCDGVTDVAAGLLLTVAALIVGAGRTARSEPPAPAPSEVTREVALDAAHAIASRPVVAPPEIAAEPEVAPPEIAAEPEVVEDARPVPPRARVRYRDGVVREAARPYGAISRAGPRWRSQKEEPR